MTAPLQVSFCGLEFSSPLVALSGCVGMGCEYTRVDGFTNKSLGAVCLKGVTPEPRTGNEPHRTIETEAGMLNSIGLQNPGIDAFIKDILPSLDWGETHYVANISGVTVDEYALLAQRLDDTPIHAIEINVSCPNVREGGLEFGNYPQSSARVVAACRAVTGKPLIVKLSPNQTDIADNARQCLDAGADAFAAINTVAGMAIDGATRRPVLDNVSGGLSGPAIKPVALLAVWKVYQVCRAHNAPIIGQGGVVSAADAIEFILAGASAVGVGTGLFYDPLVCDKINRGISDYLRDHELNNVGALVGGLITDRPADGQQL